MALHTYPSSLGNGTVLRAWIEIRVFERNSPKSSTAKDVINLYMPEETAVPNSVRWGATPMGAIGAGINAWKGSGGDAGAATWATAKAAGVNIAQEFGHKFGGAIGKLAGMNYSAEATNKAASAAFGKTMNPYLTAVFEGVDFRTFSFTFKFAPHSEGDCKLIDDIIVAFRKAALPDSHSGDAILNYPDEFEIAYKFDSKDNKWLRKFKRSVLQDISVRYGAGDQWSQHRNGFPTMITLNLVFKEMEIVLRKDVEEGY